MENDATQNMQVSTENAMLYARRCWRELFNIKFQVCFAGKFTEAINIIRSNTLK